MTDEEYKREQAGFKEHGLEFGDPPEETERYGFVATEGKTFVGCSSGLAQNTSMGYQKYFYLSDLFVEKKYRKQGYGEQLLKKLEEKVRSLGIKFIWTWTADYEAASFYKKQGYKTFVEFEDWYPSSHSRVGLVKEL